MFSSDRTAASLHNLPADAHAQLAPALSVLGMATTHLFDLSENPVTQSITALTGLDATNLSAFTLLDSTAALQQLLTTRSVRFYDYVLVGRATLSSPLAGPVRAYLRQQMQLTTEQLDPLYAYCLHLSAELENALEQFLAGPSGTAALAPLRRRQQQIQQLFLRHEASLVPRQPPVVTLGFDEGRLQMLRLSLLLVQEFRHSAAEHPFLRALSRFSGLAEPAVEALMTRLATVGPDERLGLSLAELALLYQAMHVCALASVSDVLGALGLEGAFPVAAPAPAGHATPTGSSRQAVAALVTGFTNWVEQAFGEEPIVQTARREMADLTDLV